MDEWSFSDDDVRELNDVYVAVASHVDPTITIDNPDIPVVSKGFAAAATPLGSIFMDDEASREMFLTQLDCMYHAVLGAYCMGYRRGQGKGLTLVVRDDTKDSAMASR